LRGFRGLLHTPYQTYTAVMTEEFLVGLQLKREFRRDYHTSSKNVSIALLPQLFIIHRLLRHQPPQQQYSVHYLHHIRSQLFENTELSPCEEHQQRQPYCDYKVQIHPISHFRASIIRRKIPERRTEKGCDESPRKEDEGDSGDQSHVGTVAMVELVVSLLESCVDLFLSDIASIMYLGLGTYGLCQ
jgi:hypothetical protein